MAIDRDEIIFDLESPVDSVRRNALVQIAKTYDPYFIEYLENISLYDAEPEHRFYAKKIIHAFKNNEDISIDNKSEILKTEDNSKTFVFKKENLKNEIEQYRLKKRIKISDNKLLISLNDRSSSIRYSALNKIISEKKKEFIPELVKRLEVEEDNYIKASIIKIIGEFKVKEFLAHVIMGLKSRHENIRCSSLFAVKQMVSRTDLKKVAVKMLEDSSAKVKSDAIIILKDFSDIDIFSVLKKMVYSENIEMRKNALYVLMDINDKRVAEYLKILTKDKDMSIAIQAQEVFKFCVFSKIEKEDKKNSVEEKDKNKDKNKDKKTSKIIISSSSSVSDNNSNSNNTEDKFKNIIENKLFNNKKTIVASLIILLGLFVFIIYFLLDDDNEDTAPLSSSIENSNSLEVDNNIKTENFESLLSKMFLFLKKGNYNEAIKTTKKLILKFPDENNDGYFSSILMHLKNLKELIDKKPQKYDEKLKIVEKYINNLKKLKIKLDKLILNAKIKEVKNILKNRRDYFSLKQYNYYLKKISTDKKNTEQLSSKIKKITITEVLTNSELYIKKTIQVKGEFVELRARNKVFLMKSGDDEIEVDYSKLSEAKKKIIYSINNFSGRKVTVLGKILNNWGISIIADKVNF